jgi:hypothetical protein
MTLNTLTIKKKKKKKKNCTGKKNGMYICIYVEARYHDKRPFPFMNTPLVEFRGSTICPGSSSNVLRPAF